MRLVTFAIVGAFPLLSLLPFDSTLALQEFRAGSASYARWQFPQAITHFEEAVRLDPANAEAWFYLGNAHQAIGVAGMEPGRGDVRTREAYTHALRLGLGATSRTRELKAEALAVLAELQRRSANPADAAAAVASASELVREFPHDVRALVVLAQTHDELGEAAAADAAYGKLAAAHPSDPLACGIVAEFRRQRAPLDRQEEALAAFDRCAALTPTDPDGYYKAAMVYFNASRPGPALDDERRSFLADKGLAAAERALAVEGDSTTRQNDWAHEGALIYKMLLLRVKAQTSRDPTVRQRHQDEADRLTARIQERERGRPR